MKVLSSVYSRVCAYAMLISEWELVIAANHDVPIKGGDSVLNATCDFKSIVSYPPGNLEIRPLVISPSPCGARSTRPPLAAEGCH